MAQMPPWPPPPAPPPAGKYPEERAAWEDSVGEAEAYRQKKAWQEWAAAEQKYLRDSIIEGVDPYRIPHPGGGFYGPGPDQGSSTWQGMIGNDGGESIRRENLQMAVDRGYWHYDPNTGLYYDESDKNGRRYYDANGNMVAGKALPGTSGSSSGGGLPSSSGGTGSFTSGMGNFTGNPNVDSSLDAVLRNMAQSGALDLEKSAFEYDVARREYGERKAKTAYLDDLYGGSVLGVKFNPYEIQGTYQPNMGAYMQGEYVPGTSPTTPPNGPIPPGSPGAGGDPGTGAGTGWHKGGGSPGGSGGGGGGGGGKVPLAMSNLTALASGVGGYEDENGNYIPGDVAGGDGGYYNPGGSTPTNPNTGYIPVGGALPPGRDVGIGPGGVRVGGAYDQSGGWYDAQGNYFPPAGQLGTANYTLGEGGYERLSNAFDPTNPQSWGLIAAPAAQMAGDLTAVKRDLREALPMGGEYQKALGDAINYSYGQIGGLRQGLIQNALNYVQGANAIQSPGAQTGANTSMLNYYGNQDATNKQYDLGLKNLAANAKTDNKALFGSLFSTLGSLAAAKWGG